MAWLMRRTLKTSGAETFGAALQIFTGIESMPALKGYLQTMTRSELFTVMMAFMASVATNVLLIYATFGAEPGHLMAASVMSAPAAILIAKIMVPEREVPQTLGTGKIAVPVETHNVVDAAARGPWRR
jgi:CNT family concentrative nucleoside transporter